jgi:ABC-2 type transport system ATP-binding protein
LEEMRQRIQSQRVVRVGLMGRVEEALAWLAARPDVVGVEPVDTNGEGDLRVTFAGDDEALARLLSELAGAGFPVTLFREESSDLEDVFMRLTKGVVT